MRSVVEECKKYVLKLLHLSSLFSYTAGHLSFKNWNTQRLTAGTGTHQENIFNGSQPSLAFTRKIADWLSAGLAQCKKTAYRLKVGLRPGRWQGITRSTQILIIYQWVVTLQVRKMASPFRTHHDSTDPRTEVDPGLRLVKDKKMCLYFFNWLIEL